MSLGLFKNLEASRPAACDVFAELFQGFPADEVP